MSRTTLNNEQIAAQLERVAELLEAEEENPFRIRSYRRAAESIRDSDEKIAQIADQHGREGLRRIPGIGPALAGAVREIADTGELGLMRRLESRQDPEQALTRVPGIGEDLAARIHEELGIESLEGLERAAHEGRLSRIRGIGKNRVAGIRDALAGMLSRSASRRARQRQRTSSSDGGGRRGRSARAAPSVDLLLEVDDLYRRKAEAGELRTIAPKRFNPSGEAWLPILRTSRGGWSFTALYSNTARAHERGKTRDWVVIYFRPRGKDGDERQHTVITAERGDLMGKRIVRGRERECRDYYGD